ncbi:ribbon-helix-helix protein, CopG family, partial [Microcoleus sp. CAWBG52]|uniref:ribbon-helix-helix protein, CopG family n=1 Tax=Microcoleus sp. CAWBG52 TaxID=2841649 RepID=UPI0025E3EDBD
MVKKNRNVVSSNPESKVKVGLSLTPSSADRLNAIARKLGISRSELLERLAKGALDISKDKSQVSVTWKKGEETAVETAELEGETSEKSDINDAITAETLLDSVSVQSNPLQASYEALQQQLSERESAIASLQQQLADKQNLEAQLQETVSKSSYESLQQQLSEGESAIASLQQQLAEKQNLEAQLQETVSKSSYESLQQQLSEGESAIASLQQQLAEKQNLEAQLQ